jgi:hypothetical protein
MSPEDREQLRGQFAELCTEIQGVLEEDPAGPRAQELAGRWLQLLGAFAPRGAVDPQLLKYQAADFSDGEWPAGAPQPDPPFGLDLARQLLLGASRPEDRQQPHEETSKRHAWLHYSQRSATSGSTFAARHAGTYNATSDVVARSAATPPP